MSNKAMSKDEGYILVKLGEHKVEDLVDGLEDPEDLAKMAMISISEIPHYKTGTAASLQEHEAFVKYMNLMAQYIDIMDKDEEKDD